MCVVCGVCVCLCLCLCEYVTHVSDVGPVTGVGSQNAVQQVVIRTVLCLKAEQRENEFTPVVGVVNIAWV